jgi:hypothetical protein
MVIERDDEGFDDWPGAVDPIREVISNLLITIMQNTVEGSRERKRAMSEALEAHERIRAALRPMPRLN